MTDIVEFLRKAGYQVVNGPKAVRKAIARAASKPATKKMVKRKAAKKSKRNHVAPARMVHYQKMYRKLRHKGDSQAQAIERLIAYEGITGKEAAQVKAHLRLLTKQRNPGGATIQTAKRLYKKFIGKPASKLTRKTTAHPAARNAKGGKLPVAKLATLSYLKVRNPALKGGMICFRGTQRPKLLSHPSGRQYYFHGGNQDLNGIPSPARWNPSEITAADLRRAGLDPANGKRFPKSGIVPIGEVEEIGYFERKAVEDFRPVEYYHQLGEENGKRPTLVYDPEHKQMHLVGGDYRTLWNGINN
jgi:hypothetical protein